MSNRSGRLGGGGRSGKNGMRGFQDEIWAKRTSSGAALPEAGSRVAIALDMIARDRGEGWIVDLGCGDGALLSRVEGARVGIDLSIVALRRGGDIPRICADLEGPRIPIRDGAARSCILLDSLPYLHSPRALMEEIGRVLRPGGRVIVSVPNARQLRRLFSLAAGSPIELSVEEAAYSGGQRHLFTDRSLRMLLESAGFRCESLVGVIPSRGRDPIRGLLRRLGRGGAVRAFVAPGLLAVGRKP